MDGCLAARLELHVGVRRVIQHSLEVGDLRRRNGQIIGKGVSAQTGIKLNQMIVE